MAQHHPRLRAHHLSVALALALLTALLAFAPPLQAHAAGPQADGKSGNVILCVEQDRAADLAAELGVAPKQAALAEQDPDAATGTVSDASRGCTWEVLMDASAQAVQQAQEQTQAQDEDARPLDQGGYVIVAVTSDRSSTKALLAWAEQAPGVLFAERNQAIKTDLTAAADEGDPDDAENEDSYDSNAKCVPTDYFGTAPAFPTYRSSAWFLKNTGAYAQGKVGFDLNMPAGVTATEQQVVAIIDGGVDYNNPALQPYMVDLQAFPELLAQTGAQQYGFSGVDPEAPADCMDINGHGTHCAGIVAQAATQGGTAGDVRLMAVRAADPDGTFRSDSLIRCYEFVAKARQAGVNVVAANASYGGGGYATLVERVALNQMVDSGVALSMAAGNDGSCIDGTPTSQSGYSSINGVLMVGSSNPTGNPSSFSNYGKHDVDVFAPGSSVVSTVAQEAAEYVGFLAAQNTREGRTDAPQALIYESFEGSGSADPSLGGGLTFHYANKEEGENEQGEWAVTFPQNSTPLEYSDGAMLGNRSLVLRPDGPQEAIISDPLNPDLARQLEALDFTLKATENGTLVDWGFVDEEGTWYCCDDYERVGTEGEWITLGSPDRQLLLKDVQDAMAAGTHQFRLVIYLVYSPAPVHVDTVSLGRGVGGYSLKLGTSMATPMVTGLMAVAAAQHPEASPAELCAYVKGGAAPADNLKDLCTTSGNASMAGMANPVPVVNAASAGRGVLTLDGFFFGSARGTVKVGSATAQILSWQRVSGNAYAVKTTIPASAKSGFNELRVTSASGASGRAVKNLGNITRSRLYQDLPSLADSFNDGGYATLASTSKSVYSIMVGGEHDDDSTVIRVYRYSKAKGTWSKLASTTLSKAVGVSFKIVSRGMPRMLNAGGTLYAAVNLDAADDVDRDYQKTALFKLDSSTGKLVKCLTTTRELDNLFTYGSKIYLPTVEKVTSKKASLAALKGRAKGTYLAVRQMDPRTGKLTFAGAANLKCLGEDAQYLGGTLSSINVINHRLTITCAPEGALCALTCPMSSLKSAGAAFVKTKAPFSTEAVETAAASGALALLGVDTGKGSNTTWLFNPKSRTWRNIGIPLGDTNPTGISGTGLPGSSSLYVVGEEDATVNQRLGFMRCLDLTGLAPTCDPWRPTSVKVTAARAKKGAKTRSVTVRWTKSSDATGYEVRYSTTKGMKYCATATVKAGAKKTVKVSKAAKRCYVQVRSYKSVNGTRLYSSWTTKKSVKL
ncbi:MAG: S8 family serine peptidase [Coriobacteriia bacterium]|nr:S8 family serine peptidase [Coriobacteriia bacterium]